MDTNKRLAELEQEVRDLKAQIATMRNPSQLNPDMVTALRLALVEDLVATSTDAVTSYDKSVDEGGAASYTVPLIYDGLFIINGKIVGYYDPV